MGKLLNVSSSPHVRDNSSTFRIMLDVCIALLPACVFGVVNFGVRALWVLLVSVASCVLSEFLFEKILKKPNTIGDLSAVVTGLLLGMNLPSTIPLWMAALGGVFAIVIVKQLFGGLGQNFMNPALGARCFLLISFAGRMTTFTYDGVTGATPLAILKTEGITGVNVLDMFIGNISGVIGETSVIALLVGALYLFVRRVITPLIPVVYVGVFAIFILLFGGQGFDLEFLAAHICGGGIMLGALFMATDYVTSPVTNLGKVVYAAILGVLTGLFRVFGNAAEGVSYAIIFTNLLVPIIEKFTVPRAFGVKKEVSK